MMQAVIFRPNLSDTRFNISFCLSVIRIFTEVSFVGIVRGIYNIKKKKGRGIFAISNRKLCSYKH